MGMTKIRRINKSVRSWTDKEARKHKHNFSNTCYIRKYTDIGMGTYRVNKCLYCNSFKDAEILLDDSHITEGMIEVSLYVPHKTIGFEGAIIKKN